MTVLILQIFGSSDLSDILYSLLRSTVLSLPSLVQMLGLVCRLDSGSH